MSIFINLRLISNENLLKESVTATPNISSTASTGLNHHGYPTMRPRRPDCAPPAIEQFPPPLMSANIRKVCSFYSLFTFFLLLLLLSFDNNL